MGQTQPSIGRPRLNPLAGAVAQRSVVKCGQGGHPGLEWSPPGSTGMGKAGADA